MYEHCPGLSLEMIDFVSSRLSDSIMIIEVSGNRMTEVERKYLFNCIGDLINSGIQHVIIDCDKLGYLNSMGLASLLSARKQAANKGGRIYLTGLNSTIAEAIEVAKLGRLLSVYPTPKEAMDNIQASNACVG